MVKHGIYAKLRLFDCMGFNKNEYESNFRKYMKVTGFSISLAIIIGGTIQIISWNLVFLYGLVFQVISLLTLLNLKNIEKTFNTFKSYDCEYFQT